MENCVNTCSFYCYGYENHYGSCCRIGDRSWIIGPIDDYEEFLRNISQKIGRAVAFHEVFYSYEEGKSLFPERVDWQRETVYPAFRVDTEREDKPCVLYNVSLRCCSVYDIRPQTCRNYFCAYLKESGKC